MQVPLEIAYRFMDNTEYVDGLIRKKAAKVEKAFPQMVSCRVALEQEQGKQKSGNLHRLRIDMRMPPGHEVVVTRRMEVHKPGEDLPPFIREAFEAAERQMRDLLAQQKGKIKSHPEQQTTAFVDKLFPEEGYGFIRNLEGQEIYFHRNSVINDEFADLKVGLGVSYDVSEVMEHDDGLHATSVRVIGH